MFTLHEALKLPCCDKAKVLAGENNLNQAIRHIHKASFLDTHSPLGDGTLRLSTEYNFKENVESQENLIPTLIAKGVVGIFFAARRDFETIPETFLKFAKAHHFPIVVVPSKMQFTTIVEQFYIEIINREFAVKERATDIRQKLMRIVLEGGDLHDVVTILAKILQRSILIDDAQHKLLAHAQQGPIDEARKKAIERGASSPRSISILRERGVYDKWHQYLRPLHLAAQPDLGLTMARVVAPIIVSGEILGAIWILAGEQPLTELDELSIEHTATIAALIILKEQAIQEVRRSLQGDFLDKLLLSESPLDPQTVEQGKRFHYQKSQAHQILFATLNETGKKTLANLAASFTSWLQRKKIWGLVAERDEGVILIVETDANSTGKRLGELLLSSYQLFYPSLILGISQFQPKEKPLQIFYKQAVQAADIGRRLGSQGKVICYWKLGLLNWLYTLSPEELATNLYLDQIKAIVLYDQTHQADLLASLEIYLESGGALQEAAESLHIHRNTLSYRMKRIQEILKIDLQDSQTRFNLYVALKAFRLSNRA